MKIFGNSFEDFNYEGSGNVHLILKLDSTNPFQMKKVDTVSVVCKHKCEELSVSLARLTTLSDPITTLDASDLLSLPEMVGTCTRSASSLN